ncbi:Uma2 family endonuclease [bacterium CPR1]|nr:Uma2 family endonuclease [bacterium CPR1]
MLAPDNEELYPYHEDTVTESDWHLSAIHYLLAALRGHFARRADGWVFSNMFVYDQCGNTKRKVSPDVFVVFGSTRASRRVYRTWCDGGPPAAVFEVTSLTTRKADQTTKRARYGEMGVQEYFLFDPLGEYLPGQLRVYRREGGELVPVIVQGRYRSELLGVDLVVEREILRVIDLETGQPYLTSEEERMGRDEERRRADEERKRADEERKRADALAEEIRLLREQLKQP